MEAIRDAGVQRVVLASSGAVYGQQASQPLTEDMIPDPDSPYAVSKLSAEIYVRTIGTLWGIETVALRVFNAYGPGQQLPAAHAPVTTRFLRAAITKASLVIFGEGEQTRDFVYVDDVVQALIAAATARDVDRQVINVGSGVETSVLELAETIGEVTGRTIEPLFNTRQVSGVERMRADLTRSRQMLGYDPSVTLAEGLRRTIAQDDRFTL
jgi:UDP-glucose 4-epimerase